MQRLYSIVVFFILLVTCNLAYSQRGSVDTAEKTSVDTSSKKLKDSLINSALKKRSALKVSLSYVSNNVFYGRADTVTTPTLMPELKFSLKNGLFVSANAGYITNRAKNKLDGENITIGYDHDFTEDLSGGITFSKLFYSATSTQIGSSISGTVNANVSYDIADIITPTLSLDYDFIKNGFSNDLIVNLGASHEFRISSILGLHDEFTISPTVEINAGTQNFYDAFLTTKKYKTTAKAIAANAKLRKQFAKLNRFNMLDYELSAPLSYKTGNLTISSTPTYAIAENKLAPGISKNLVTSNGLFYFTAGVAYNFD